MKAKRGAEAWLILSVVLLLSAAATNALHKPTIEFSGTPRVRVNESGHERTAEQLSGAKQAEFSCVITEINGKYYWATRENKELVKTRSGAFITYLAVDGTGYVRVIPADRKQVAGLMSTTEASFDYVEHMLLGLRTVTYYGVAE